MMSQRELAETTLQRLHDALRSEAELHWQRNNYFLVIESILLLALSQFRYGYLEALVSLLGLTLSFAWLLIVHRSDRYILHWKKQIRKLEGDTETRIYPEKLGGIEIETRKVAYVLPISFLLLWAAVLYLLSVNGFVLPSVK